MNQIQNIKIRSKYNLHFQESRITFFFFKWKNRTTEHVGRTGGRGLSRTRGEGVWLAGGLNGTLENKFSKVLLELKHAASILILFFFSLSRLIWSIER